MGKTILLTGRPGCGKMTIIGRVVAELSIPAGGFYTREIVGSRGREGFEIVTLDGGRGTLAHVNRSQSPRVGKYGVDLSALEEVGVKAIKKAIDHGEIIIIDEIGPMELKSKLFQDIVLQAVLSPWPVLGTIALRPSPFSGRLKSFSQVFFIDVTPENREALPHQLLASIGAE
jgi:nucleoside-triphosphatase